jgi:tRNA modification GTPase
MYPLDDTIAAVASPPGGAARGIVRLSGPAAVDIAKGLFRAHEEPHREFSRQRTPLSSPIDKPAAITGELFLSGLHSPMPCDLYVWPRRRSYTGQPVVELHTLGSPPLLDILLRAVCGAGARLAGPGEFTLRAFLAGRIDLSQAEAVLGVIDARDNRELHAALEQLAGGLAKPLQRIRADLLDLLAHIEAGFDFADEDLTFITRNELDQRLAEAEAHSAAILRQMSARDDRADAAGVVLVGRPNVGKSSLWNALVGDHAAIVSHLPGTTRDYLAAELDLGGVKCRLIDTAGATRGPTVPDDEVGHAAQSAGDRQRRAAAAELLCIDSTRPLDDWEHDELYGADSAPRIVILTKCDAARATDFAGSAVETSACAGIGIAAVRDAIRQRLLRVAPSGDIVDATAVRCAESLRLAGESLGRARRVASSGQEELVAAELRAALDDLGKVVGTVYTDDVLDGIFRRFCVGK